MLTPETIKNLAQKYQTTAGNIRQEYIQHLFLAYFYQQPQASKVYFKGGTALRIMYNSPRFSEDLDFSATLYSVAPLEEAVLATLQAIEREAIPAEIRDTKKTSGGYLAIIVFTLGADKVNLRLEISLRQVAKGNKTGTVATIVSDFLPPYTLVGLDQKQLVGEKLPGAAEPGQAKGFL
jgi:predicted nucleotidyltransferase component of viral defense system